MNPWLLLLALSSAGACVSSDHTGGEDAGARDAGPSHENDASPAADAASPSIDGATQAPDGGATPDGGTAPDASTADGGQDAGGLPVCEPGVDAGPCEQPIFSVIGPLHATGVRRLQQSDDRILSVDGSGFWLLWDVDARTALLSGTMQTQYGAWVQLAGDTLAVVERDHVELRAAHDGALLTRISVASNVQDQLGLSPDGSYYWSATNQGVFAWSPSGQLVITREGDYRAAAILATPTALHIARGPAGAKVIEQLSTAGARLTHTFTSGEFHSWFVDGGHFLTNLGNAVWVQTENGEKLGPFDLPHIKGLTGQGEHFWTVDTKLDVFRVDAQDSTPVASFGVPGFMDVPPVPVGTDRIGIVDRWTRRVDVVTLGASNDLASYDLPITSITAFAGDGERFCIGNSDGVVLDSTSLGAADEPQSLSPGRITSVAGSGSGRAAVALANGWIAILDATGDAPAVSSWIPFAASDVKLDDQATQLVAMADQTYAQYSDDPALTRFALPSGELIDTLYCAELPCTYQPIYFELSRDGRVLSAVLRSSNDLSARREVLDLETKQVLWSDTGSFASIMLSPDGSHWAMSAPGSQGSPEGAVRIFSDGLLADAVSGAAMGWLDDTHLLLEHQKFDESGGELLTVFDYNAIYDAVSGQEVETDLPDLTVAFPIAEDLVYNTYPNAIYAVSSGEVVWSGPAVPANSAPGAAAGDFVLWTSANALSAQRWR